MSPSFCRSCNARVAWVITEAGKNMPIDFADVPDGNVIVDRVERTQWGSSIHVRTLHKDEETEALRYVSHFVTCPDRREHRKSS